MPPRLLPHAFRLLLMALPFSGQAQLNGTYVIDGGGGGDYLSFTAAVTDLTTLGIAGPVVFEVVDGTYTEQISIPAITGSSAINTIAFRGQSLDSTTVTLTSSGGGNYLIDLNGASYITFEHLGLQRTGSATLSNIVVINGSSHVTIRNNRMETVNSTLTTIGVRCHVYSDNATTESAVSILNNRMTNGLFGLFWDGNGQADDIQFNGNIIEDGSIHVTAVDGGLEIVGNDVTQSLSAEEVIHVASCNVAMLIGENHFLHSNGGTPPNTGYFNGNNGALGAEGVIRNNMFLTTGVYAGAVAIYSSSHQHYLHNSSNRRVVIVSNTDTEVRANLFYNLNGSYRTFSGDNGITLCDHNIYWSSSATKQVSWNGTILNSLAALQAANGMDANSLWEDPLPVDPNVDLHILSTSPCIGAAPDPPLVTVDIDQDTRPSPVASVADIGADESPVACSPMSGTYIIGSSGLADHPTFNSAVAAMLSCGLGGPVVFEVENGIYVEQFALPAIPGNSATNTITFRGQSLDSSAVIIRWPAGAPANNYVVQMEGADHVTFEHLTMHRSNGNNGTWGAQVLHFNGFSSSDPSQNCTFSHVRFMANPIQNVNYWRGLVTETTSGLSEQHITFSFCRFQGGHEAFRWNSSTGQDDFLTITDCYTTQSYGAFAVLAMDDHFTLARNTFENLGSTSYTFAVSLSYNTGGFLIEDNIVRTVNMYGIRLYINDLPSSAHGVIRNNMIALTATNTAAAGIFMSGRTHYVDILNNSISMVGGAAIDEVGTLGGNDIVCINNICRVSDAAAHPIYKNGTATWGTISHNALFNAGGGDLAYWNGAAPNLNALQGLSAGFCPTVLVDPLFVNNATDLHLQFGSPCQGTGTNLASVTSDLDGETRPNPVGSFHDIGADETAVCAPLNGTYVIGTSCAAGFPDFTTAIDRMITCGIDGPVVFEVEDGTYTEQITLPTITGNSNVNTITFRGQSLDSSLVTLTWPNGSALPTVRFAGADRVSFEHLTISRTGTPSLPGKCVDWESTIADATTRSEYIHFRHCRLLTNSTHGLSVLAQCTAENDENNVTFEDSRFEGGYIGLHWQMNYSALTLEVRRCSFTGQRLRSIQLNNAGTGDPEVYIEGNDISGPTNSSSIAVDIAHNANLLQIIGNRITATAANGVGLQLMVDGLIPSWQVVRNNMIACSGSARGIQLTGTVNGLGMHYNSVSTVSGFALNITASGSGNELIGNILRSNTGYALYRTGGLTFSQAHHDLLWSAGGNLAFWGGPHSDLPCLQAATGQFGSSLSVDPLFVDDFNDLHLQSNSTCTGQGIAIPGLSDDLDGDARSLPAASAPDLGADEINADCTLLAGTYVIGPSLGADFTTFSEAMDRIVGCGITGPVVFEVENGTYTEQLRIAPIKGSSIVNTVTFRGQALDSTSVILQWPSQSTNVNNYLLLATGGDHVRFEHMTLRRTGTFNFSTVVQVETGCEDVRDLRIAHCELTNNGTISNISALIYHFNSGGSASLDLQACLLENGSYPVYWDANGSGDTLTITQCVRTGGVFGIRVLDNTAPTTISQCQLDVTNTDNAVLVSACTGPITILANRITGGIGVSSSGIYLTGIAPVAPGRAVVANNEVIFSSAQGIRLQDVSRTDLVFNSVRMTTSGRYALLATGTGSDVVLRNNIFSTFNQMTVNTSLTGTTGDRNCFQRTGVPGPVVSWNGAPYTTVAALSAGTGTNANSLIADPLFFDPFTDLHAYGMDINAAAMPFAGITTDIDGDPRDPATPDIGCDEFTPQLWNEQFDVCVNADPAVSDGSGRPIWIYRDRKVIARIQENGNMLGTINSEIYIHTGPVRQSGIGQYYMDRNWRIEPQNPITGAGVDVRLFYHANEFAALAAADPAVTITSDAGVSQYDGPNENCLLADNTAVGNYFMHFPTPTGMDPEIGPATQVGWYDATVAGFSEFYITTQGLPLPVELLSLSGERQDRDHVRLTWLTASEQDNAGFEVWRRIEGETSHQRVGWVDGAGNSVAVLEYGFLDPNPTERISYYHLRQYDHDGAFEDSPVVAVAGMKDHADLTVFPNPTSGPVQLAGDVASILRLEVLDQAGRTVRTPAAAPTLDLSGLPAGTYVLRFQLRNGAVHHERLVVQ